MLVKPGSNASKSKSFTPGDNPDPGVFKQFGLPILKQLSVLLHSPPKCTDPLQNQQWPKRSRSIRSYIQPRVTHYLPEPRGNLLSRAESVPHWPEPFSAYELDRPSRHYVSSFSKPFQQIMANCYQKIMVGLNNCAMNRGNCYQNCAINRGNRAPTRWKSRDFGALPLLGEPLAGPHLVAMVEVDWSPWGCLRWQNRLVVDSNRTRKTNAKTTTFGWVHSTIGFQAITDRIG